VPEDFLGARERWFEETLPESPGRDQGYLRGYGGAHMAEGARKRW
jgi:hypothetical protein